MPQSHIYFAIYTFTLPSIADALVAAKNAALRYEELWILSKEK